MGKIKNLLLVISILTSFLGLGQTTLFSDNFGTSTGTAWDISSAIGTSTEWYLDRSGADWGAKIDGGQLQLTNDASGTANVAGSIYAWRVMSGTGWSSTLSSCTGLVTWEFNMKQITANPSGFDASNYGVAFVLAGTSSVQRTTGQGYAVVLGQSGNTDPVRLVSFNGGFNTNTSVTNIITSNTAGLTDFGNNYLSIRVTYNPTSNTWRLFVRNDTTAFTDPSTGTLVSQGTAVNNTYTGTAGLDYMGGYWEGAAADNQTAFFDNVYHKICQPPTSPSFSAGATTICVGGTSTYTASATGGTSVTYSILSGGASINSSTGVVSSVTSNFTVRATISNACGSSTTVDRSVTVNSPTISYAGSPYQYTQNTAIANLTPTTTGTSFSATLPSGLSINSSTGVISGTPTGTQVATSYTINTTGANSCSNSTSISIAIRPSNDLCSGATSLPCGTSGLSGTTVGSLTETPPASAATSSFGVWYSFIGNGQVTTLSSTAVFDHEMVILTGNSCGSFSIVASIDNEVSNTAETYTFTATNTQQYYVWIAHYSAGNTTTGSFTISRTCTTPAVNDLCSNATSLTIDAAASSQSFSGSTASGGSYADPTYPDTWYTFTTTCSGTYQVTFTNSSYDVDAYLYSSCASTTNLLTGGATSSLNESGTATLNANTTYYLRMVDFDQAGSTYSLQVTTVTTTSAAPSAITGSSSVCPSTTGLTYSVTNVSGTTYNWTLPSGFTQTGGETTNSITVTSGSTSGTLSVTATTSCGTSTSTTLSITVNSAPSVTISPSSPSICLGDIQTLTSSASTTTIVNVGPNGPVGSSAVAFGIGSFYNIFDVTQASTLVSVDVFPTTTIGSSASIVIANSVGTVLSTTNYTTTVTGGARQTVTINYNMSVGTGYRIGQGGSGISLIRETGLGGYPYTSSFANITGSNNGTTYYYFYKMAFSTTNTITWSPVTDLFTNTTGTTAYVDGTSTQTVYANPSTTGSYTSTVTYGNGCSTTANVSITVNQPSPTSINSATGQTLTNGDYVWDGSTTTSWGTSSNWYVYNGTSFDVVTSSPTSTSNVVIVPNSTTQCISSTNSPLLNLPGQIKDLTIVPGVTLDLSNNILSVSGNFKEDGSIVGTGTINLNGSGTQTVSGTGTLQVPNLTVNKVSGQVTLSNPLRVTNTFTMTSGNIVNGSNVLEVGSSTSSLGSINWTSGTVTGPLKRWFGNTTNSTQSSGIFPVGNSSYNRYAQINFTSNPTSGGSITTQYVSGIPSLVYDGLPLTTSDGQLVQNYEDEGYWDITPDSYTGSLNQTTYTISLRGNNLSNPTDISVARIIKSEGPSHTTWQGCGTHGSASGTISDFTINSTSNTGFSFFNIGSTNNSPLPIELLSFTANCSDDGTLITWKTASESNTSHFNLEKSRNGIDWEIIHTEQAAGNSTQLVTYNFTDKSSLNGLSYYRLNQYDLDGVYEQFGPISINCLQTSNGYFSVFPNPSSTEFSIIVNNDLLIGDATLLITNKLGKDVYMKSIKVEPGINLYSIDKLDISTGVYYISIINSYYTSGVLKQIIR